MALMFRAALIAGALAATTMIAVPAAAGPLSASLAPAPAGPSAIFAHSRFDPAAESAAWGRCGWGGGWGCGWGGGWGGRGWRRNRIDGGDILIGAAIIGGAIAIANANNRRQRERDVVIVERDADLRDRNWDRNRDGDRRDDRRSAPRGTGASGLDNAVNICLDRIERDVRVDTVDNVERTGAGWRVSGALYDGSAFQCRIGNGGQIDGIDYGRSLSGVGLGGSAAPAAPRADGQFDDAFYADARARVGGTVRPDMAVSGATVAAALGSPGAAMPAYPGGPIPGEVIPETIDGDIGG
jgi:hypothetical protein